jgi:hypothetical protein
MKTRHVCLFGACLASAVLLFPVVSVAQTVRWSESIAACQELIHSDATNDELQTVPAYPFGGGPGAYMQHSGNAMGSVLLFCPVVIDAAVTVNHIELRAYDNYTDANTYVKATLFRQSWVDAAVAMQLSQVQSANSAAIPHRTIGAAFGPVTIDNDNFTYYIVIEIARSSNNFIPRAYQVRLTYQ